MPPGEAGRPTPPGACAPGGRSVRRIDRELVATLTDQGYSVGHIAQRLAVSCSSVRRIQLEMRRAAAGST